MSQLDRALFPSGLSKPNSFSIYRSNAVGRWRVEPLICANEVKGVLLRKFKINEYYNHRHAHSKHMLKEEHTSRNEDYDTVVTE